jgi:SAM-dependent methyltransferase
MSKSLDLGCGPKPKNPFSADEVMGVDIREDLDNNIFKADIVKDGIPFPDNSFDYVTAYDFIEHIPRIAYTPDQRYPFIEVMNEIFRVLKPGGKFFSHTPAYPKAEAFQDPTHVNIITKDTFRLYFDHQRILARMYGFNGAFIVRSQRWRGAHLLSVLEKTTPPEHTVVRSRFWFQRMVRGY